MKKFLSIIFIFILTCTFIFRENELSINEIKQSLRYFLMEEPDESCVLQYKGKTFSALKKEILSLTGGKEHFYSYDYLKTTTYNEIKDITFRFPSKTKSEKKYVIIKSRAGFGNQLFHYAAGYALSKRLNAILILNQEKAIQNISSNTLKRQRLLDLFNVEYDVRLFNKNAQHFGITTKIKNALINFAHYFNFSVYPRTATYNKNCVYVTNDNLLSVQAEDATVFLIGYENGNDEKYWYESYDFFKNHIQDIRKMINLDVQENPDVKTVIDEMKSFENSVAVHVRRGDFLNKDNERFVMPMTYYGRSMEKIFHKYPDAQFFIFTDSPDLVKPLFLHLKNCKIVSNGVFTNIEEFFMMKECKHLIAGNSTFSSWVGLLKTTGDVIAPFQKRYNINEDRSVYPDNWILINPFVVGE